jgi:hypothetical protein
VHACPFGDDYEKPLCAELLASTLTLTRYSGSEFSNTKNQDLLFFFYFSALLHTASTYIKHQNGSNGSSKYWVCRQQAKE